MKKPSKKTAKDLSLDKIKRGGAVKGGLADPAVGDPT